MKKNKKPKFAKQPQTSKSVPVSAHPGSSKIAKHGGDAGTDNLRPVWKFEFFDDKGPWGRDILGGNHVWDDLYPKLKNFESMTWNEIKSNKKINHSVPKDSLIKKARDRLEDLQLNDIDELFRFRLSGTQRLWGIRNGNAFQILWWDPEHEVCTSTLK